MRVVAATHRDLTTLVSSGAFREDLFYRFNVVPIALPPVRDRLADIVPLAEHFLRLSSRGGKPKRLTSSAAARLLAYSWPGNAREIKNVIERANVLVRGEIIDANDLELGHAEHSESKTFPAHWLDGDLPTALGKLEKAMIVHALTTSGGESRRSRTAAEHQSPAALRQNAALRARGKIGVRESDTTCRET